MVGLPRPRVMRRSDRRHVDGTPGQIGVRVLARASGGDARSLPSGTLTFLFTDVEGSTRLWDVAPAAMRAALIRHDALIAEIVSAHRGHLVRPRGEGDSRFCV